MSSGLGPFVLLSSPTGRYWFCWPTFWAAYLVVVPLALYAWMNQRWHRMGKLERLSILAWSSSFSRGWFCLPPPP